MIAAVLLSAFSVLSVAVPDRSPAHDRSQVAQSRPEVIAEVRVHGNQIVPDAEVLQIAGVVAGVPFTDAILADATQKLKASGKFESIDVLKRFASIDDPSKILVVIIVNEGPVRIVMPGPGGGAPQVQKRSFFSNFMFVPVLEGQDGYGLTYGARVAYPRIVGRNSRLSIPLLWGGTKRVGLELDRTFSRGPFSRIEFAGALQRRNNPAYEERDNRRLLWARAQRNMGPVRAGVSTGWQGVSFGLLDDSFRTIGGDVTLDTRTDSALPRNSMLVVATAERVFFRNGDAVTRTRVDAKGYIGLFGQHVLMLHALREDANGPVPEYMRSILGGYSTVRGFKTGFLTGDTLAAASIEWRIPITSPMRIGKLGVTVFADWGTAYDHGQALRNQPIYNGLGGSVWYSVASFRLSMAVAKGQHFPGVRVHFSGGIGF